MSMSFLLISKMAYFQVIPDVSKTWPKIKEFGRVKLGQVQLRLKALSFVVGLGVIKEFKFCSPSCPRHAVNGVVGVID